MNRGISYNFTGYMVKGLLLLVFLVGILGYPLWANQEQAQEPIVEEVTVTNVEVPVRVLHKGTPIINLSKDDFVIYENNKEMEINGFFIKYRKIKMTQPTGEGRRPRPRTFVLAFNITNYNTYFQEAMDHLFTKILEPTDHIIVFANDTTREYRSLDNATQIKNQIIDDLKRESQKVKRRLLDYITKIESYLEVHDFKRFLDQTTRERAEDPIKKAARKLVTFLQRYLLAWNEYKKNYLTPSVESFYYFARYLEKVKAEKYVLNFYQFEYFPRIRLNSATMQKIRELSNFMSNTSDGVLVSQGHMINNLLNQLLTDYDLNKGFPNEEISKLFYKVDATFHSFFIRAANPATWNEFDYRIVASDLENVLKGITDITGGKNITSNDLASSLDTVSEVEDVYYILTYAPQDPKKTGALKIKVRDKKYKVLYDNNFRADYINEYLQKLDQKIDTPDVKIENFSFRGKILAFKIKDYMMRVVKEKGDKPIGVLKVRIHLKDSNNNSLFNQEKMLTAQKNEMSISLPTFKNLGTGEYNFLIDATDLITGKEANFHQSVIVR